MVQNITAILNDQHRSYRVFLRGWKQGRHITKIALSRAGDVPLLATVASEELSISRAFDALNRAQDLFIKVLVGNHPQAVCAMQDALFTLANRIPADGLRSLRITITVSMPNDDSSHDLAVCEQAATPFLRLQKIQEFKAIVPGQLSRPHLVAFLTDPFRTLRGLQLTKGEQGFSLTFDGCKGDVPAWSEIPRRMRDMIQGESEIKDYEFLRRHRVALVPLVAAVQALNDLIDTTRRRDAVVIGEEEPRQIPTPPRAPLRHVIDLTGDDIIDLTEETAKQPVPELRIAVLQSKITAALYDLTRARIQGNVKNLRQHRRELLRRAERLAEQAETWSSRSAAGTTAVSAAAADVRAVIDTLQQDTLPRNTDVSFYGYNEMDAQLIDKDLYDISRQLLWTRLGKRSEG